MNAAEQTVTKHQIQRFLYAVTIVLLIVFIGNSLILWNSFSYRIRFLNEGVKTTAQILSSKRITPRQVQISLQVNTGDTAPFTTNYDVGCSASKAGCGVSDYPIGGSVSVYYNRKPAMQIELASKVENSKLEWIWLGIDMILLIIVMAFFQAARRVG